MNAFEGFTREEVIRSGSNKIPGSAVLEESWPCVDCPCWKACAECELSCQAFKQYTSMNKKKSMRWPEKMRIPTRAEFIEVFTPQRVGSV